MYSHRDPTARRPERTEISVELDFKWRPFHSIFDASLDDGRIAWGYILERANDSDPWKIVDEGVG